MHVAVSCVCILLVLIQKALFSLYFKALGPMGGALKFSKFTPGAPGPMGKGFLGSCWQGSPCGALLKGGSVPFCAPDAWCGAAPAFDVDDPGSWALEYTSRLTNKQKKHQNSINLKNYHYQLELALIHHNFVRMVHLY